MRELPAGTVTFLFSDIEGSTGLLHELGDAYAGALADHRDAVREVFASHGGVEVDTQGDAFFAAFARASDAVVAAAEIQSRLAPGPIRVRIGVHTGEPQITEEGYVGLDVHRGARVCAAGHGGQVLLTQPTRELVDAGVSDLGEHRLKDLLEPQRLYQLGTDEFPPLKTLDATNLPVQATPLVGRERELAEAAALLREQRVLTVVGPPGTGKTRLALQLAADAADDFEHVWWVGLQDVHDPELVEPTIAQVVGARTDLAGYLRDRNVLLLLDNVEQVVGCAPRLAELVSGSSNLKLLATSREPLRLTLEQQYPVPPLLDDDAVVLFNERARAVRPDFAANGAVAEICRRLDGLPLAIELAAARVKLLPPQALLERLEQRFSLLTGGARDLPERHQTLRATIEWSYELLEPGEQELLAGLSVFAGGWTLAAAEAVCAFDLETLASLVDKNLVRQRDERFSMLETIREYAKERLDEQTDAGSVHRRHAENFLEGAEARGGDFSEMSRDEFDWFVREQDNLRAALDWLHEQNLEQELRLLDASSDYWDRSGYWIEGCQRLEAALEASAGMRVGARAEALRHLADLLVRQDEYARAKELMDEALMLLEELGIRGRRHTHALIMLAICEHKLGNPARALELYEAASTDADEAARATILGNLGNVALEEDDFAGARVHIEEAAAINRGLGNPALANNLMDLGFIALAEDRLDDAEAAMRESLSLCRAERLGDLLLWVVEGVATVAFRRGSPVEAVSLLAATTGSRLDMAVGGDFFPIAEEMRKRTLAGAQEQLTESAFAEAWADGANLSLDEAAELAARVQSRRE